MHIRKRTMKKKILSIALVVAMVAILAAGSFAYFTDKDAAENVFTAGNVDIKLNENFDAENAQLIPGKNIQKEVTIENKGLNDAYVWYEWLIPAALDSTDGSTGTNNVLHVNSYGRTWDKYRENSKYWADGQTEALPLDETWDHTPKGSIEGFVGTETINGVVYNKYVALYHGKLAAGEETTPAMSKVYLDKAVDCVVADDGSVTYTIKGNDIGFDLNDTKIIVRAYAIQAEGFADVYAAYAAFNA